MLQYRAQSVGPVHENKRTGVALHQYGKNDSSPAHFRLGAIDNGAMMALA